MLLRAIEPLEGINRMKRFRKTDKLRDLADIWKTRPHNQGCLRK